MTVAIVIAIALFAVPWAIGMQRIVFGLADRWHDASVARAQRAHCSPIRKLDRDHRLAFHGRVRQQIRVIPPTSDR